MYLRFIFFSIKCKNILLFFCLIIILEFKAVKVCLYNLFKEVQEVCTYISEILWRILEIHIIKIVFLSTFCLAAFDVSYIKIEMLLNCCICINIINIVLILNLFSLFSTKLVILQAFKKNV